MIVDLAFRKPPLSLEVMGDCYKLVNKNKVIWVMVLIVNRLTC